MAKFSLRDYCREKLPSTYVIRDDVTEEAVTLKGSPVKKTVEALAHHASEFGIKAVKFPDEQLTTQKVGKQKAGACSGEVAGALVEGWFAAEEEALAPKAPANGRVTTVPVK